MTPNRPSDVDWERIRQDEGLLVLVLGRNFDLHADGHGRYHVEGDGDSISVFHAPSGWRYRRWSRDEQGDVLDLLMTYEGAKNALDAARMIVDLPPPPVLPGRRIKGRRKPASWFRYWSRTVGAYAAHPLRYRLWRAYRPLSPQTIERWQLGVGILRGTRCPHPRLVYPVFEPDGRGGRTLVSLRGRSLPFSTECVPPACPKWTNSLGSIGVLFNMAALAQSEALVVVIPEQPVDAMLFMQQYPERLAVASTAGVGLWRDEWTQFLAAHRTTPLGQERTFYVVTDNGLAGQPNRETERLLLATWRASHPGQERQPPMGPRIARNLADAGCRVLMHQWPPGTPPEADLGWLLQKEMGLP